MKKSAGIFLIASIMFISSCLMAEAATTTVGDFELTANEPLFTVTGAAPGQEFSSPISIKNIGSEPRDVQFRLLVTNDQSNMSDCLILKINRVSGGQKVCLFGCSGDRILRSFNNSEVIFSNIAPGTTASYELVMAMEADEGNGMQGKNMSFDMTLGYVGTFPVAPSGDRGDNDGGGDNDRERLGTRARQNVPGAVPGAATGLDTGEVEGASVSSSDDESAAAALNGQTEGVSVVACQGWPAWVWYMLMGIFLAGLLADARKKFGEEKISGKLAAALVVIFFTVWYFFDRCREFSWFLYAIVISGFLAQLIYLYMFRKKLSGNGPEAGA